ncbi:MAG TPA: aminotransferase class I/II-fold pyridoxal phosphate-dependent enzyme [Gemmataceae bacterium]|nr:aminotransferase class I/II-fold pyridoxal phosphate-dependent enzyme [Gemmataceae bacterium]
MDESQTPPPLFGPSTPLTPPLYPSAVYVLPDLDALDRILDSQESGFIYARDAHPNARRLAAQLAELEGARWAIATSSGMAAISAIVLANVEHGQRIVASHRLYGRTTQLFQQELPRLGVQTTFVDISDLNQVHTALQSPARLLFVETMSNPLLRIADLPALAQLAHDAKCLLVVDNTFATPVLVRPLDWGADFVMESATKMIGGHSDVTLGLVCSNNEMHAELSQVSSIWGFSSSPFDCWLAERGLDTLPLRMKTACANAAALADWLPQQPGVTRVIYPGRADHPDHGLAARLLHGGFGNMLCFDLAGGRAAVNRFMRQSPAIPFSPSLGHTTTTCSHPATTSHRYVSPAEKERQGISDGLVRLSVGVEDLSLIQGELAKGLSEM